MTTIATIVEGHGEVKALPILIRRILHDVGIYPQVPEPHRLARSKATSIADVSRAVRLASYRVNSGGGVLVLMDADDDCAVALAAEIRQAAGGGFNCPLAVVSATREYESVFLAAAASLYASGHFVEPDSIDDPERKRGAKEAVARRLGTSYKEVLHQPRLTGAMDLGEATRCGWFAKFHRDVLRLAGVFG